MTSRLPTVGGDNDNWGTILNDYLQQALASDGTLVTSATNPYTSATNTNLATGSKPGLVQLTGDLGGTSTSPTVPGLTSKAPLASPTFTGTVTVPSPSNSTDAATKGYVDTSVTLSVVTKTSAYTVTTSDNVVLADASSASFNVTLPTAVGNTRAYSVKKIDSSSHTVTVLTTSSQTIDGGSSAVLKVQYASISLASDGSNWYIT